MMFERFTDDARSIVVTAREEATRLGHRWIGCEHLLLAIAGIQDPTGAVLRDADVTPERIRTELQKMGGGRAPVSLFDTLDREALATIGIDLDVVRGKVEEVFGPYALRVPHKAPRRWWRRPRAGRRPAQQRTGHIPFTQRAKKVLELGLREALAQHCRDIGVEHVALGLLRAESSAVKHILSEIGVSVPTLHADIVNRYRQAS
jgi:ATP-dependent Clp protease ATP-binding subunit ClpA